MEGIWPGHRGYTPTLYDECHGIFNDHRESGPRFNVSSERRDEKSYVEKVLEGLVLIDLSNTPLKRTDCWVLKYCLQCCEHIRNLKLHVTPDNLKMLIPELYCCKELW